jgi:hypothetical protein
MMSVEVLVDPQCRVGLAPTVRLIRRDEGSGGELGGLGVSCAVGGDRRVPGGAGGDHGVQVPQIAAAITVCAWVGVSRLVSRVVRCR